MILLTGNIALLLKMIVLLTLVIFLPVAIASWYLLSKTTLYNQTYTNGTPSQRATFLVVAVSLILIIFSSVAYGIFTYLLS